MHPNGNNALSQHAQSRPGRRRGFLHAHSGELSRLLRLIDPLLVMGLFWLQVGRPMAHRGHGDTALLEVFVVGLLTALLLPLGKIYRSYRQSSLFTLLRRLTTSWALIVGSLLSLAFGAKLSAAFSRVEVTSWALTAWGLLVALHVGARVLLRWHRMRGGNSRRVLYFGTPDAAMRFHQRLQNAPHLGMRMDCWFSPFPPAREHSLPADMPPYRGNLADMRRWLDIHNADQIVFSYVSQHDMSMQDMIHFFGDTCVPVVYAPSWVIPGMTFKALVIDGQPCIDLWSPMDSTIDWQLKRSFDLAFAGTAVLLLSPLLLAIALAIRLTSPGPVFFLQDRYGLDGRRFRIYKFRTMRVLEAGDQQGLRQATRDDPRITPLGAVLRRWSLDELPQLFNVLKGDMSLVGPRPHAVDHNEKYRRMIPGYMQRHLYKPGITGLAQVNGFRGETSTLELMALRVAADLEYQREWTLQGDIKILIKTLLHIRSPNAY